MGDFISSVSEFLSTLVASLVAVLTLKITFRNERKKADSERRDQVRFFLGALKTEIDTWWPINVAKFGVKIESPDRTGKIGQLVVSDNYFPVYKANAYLLGLVADGELRSQIVRTYSMANGVFDSIRLYSLHVDNALPFSGPHAVGSSGATVARYRWQEVRDFVPALQAEHQQLSKEVEKLQSLLASALS